MSARFACFHRTRDGRPLPNGFVYAASPRDALATFKILTSIVGRHYVVREGVQPGAAK